ncbi:hypothetical protein JL101_023115 [Skermanella rosea]|uniref:hypothetical protein n=1 Tax=Skermanella rosea TaxID=1817965 RepID=UPI0019345F93|nr:hypothetical protein [Skermanella rosea]UEM02835.1 hypothetical protein JL101_023115 [Skermanella rosea]
MAQDKSKPEEGRPDRPETTSQPSGQPSGSVREENTGTGPQPGDERLDMDRTPGDGSLQGSTPAGLSVKELLERAEGADDLTQPGTS